LNFTFSVI